MTEEYVTSCVVDMSNKTIHIESNEGDEKTVVCETVDQFMNVLEVIRASCPEDMITYGAAEL